MTAARRPVDWERIEAQYRAGAKSVREIADEHAVSHTAIQKRAKKEDWTRDLNGKVKAKADALVAKELVASSVAAETTITEKLTVEVEAQVQARIRLSHRKDITRMRALVLRLLEECEAEAAEPGLFLHIGELLRSPDEKGTDKLSEAYHKAISLPQRIKGVKELAETMRVLIGLEREAYGINVEHGGSGDFEKLLQEIHEATVA